MMATIRRGTIGSAQGSRSLCRDWEGSCSRLAPGSPVLAPAAADQRASRDASSSIECASFTSSAVMPPASWVLRSTRTVFQTLNHSG